MEQQPYQTTEIQTTEQVEDFAGPSRINELFNNKVSRAAAIGASVISLIGGGVVLERNFDSEAKASLPPPGSDEYKKLEAAAECNHTALEELGIPSVAIVKKPRKISRFSNLKFNLRDLEATTWQPDSDSTSCNSYGNRSIKVAMFIKNNKNKLQRGSKWQYVAKNTNEEIDTLASNDPININLLKPYTCLEGKARRGWAVKIEETAHYKPLKPKKATTTIPASQLINKNWGC